jgi:hypothetical protein
MRERWVIEMAAIGTAIVAIIGLIKLISWLVDKAGGKLYGLVE